MNARKLLLPLVLTATVAWGATEVFDDLGEYANVSNSFWCTKSHAAVQVSVQTADVAQSTDLRGMAAIAVATPSGFDPLGKTYDESDYIGFRSDPPKGQLIIVR